MNSLMRNCVRATLVVAATLAGSTGNVGAELVAKVVRESGEKFE
jgi:hypothetical protein